MRIGIITGASSGLGREFAMQLSKEYSELEELWVIARRKERLNQLKKVCPCKLRILDYDLTDPNVFDTLKKILKEEQPEIEILINGSGFGKRGKFTDISFKDNLAMIDLNCKALTAVTYLCIPYMKPGSHIVEIASSAAFLPQPGFLVYAATKSYVLSFSRALRAELAPKKIHVMAICPGPVSTEFFQISDKGMDVKPFRKALMADPNKVVAVAIKGMKQKKEQSVYGFIIKLFHLISKVLPHRLLIFLSNKM